MDSYPELYQVTEDNFVQFSTYIKRIISDNSDRMVIKRLQYINLGGVAEYKDTKTKFDLMLMDTLKNKGAYETLRGLVISIHVKDLVGGCLCVCVGGCVCVWVCVWVCLWVCVWVCVWVCGCGMVCGCG